MRKVPSVDEADDGVPADVGADEVEETEIVALVLEEFCFFLRLSRSSSRRFSLPLSLSFFETDEEED